LQRQGQPDASDAEAVGIDAIPISIYAGDPDYVRAEWPSPQQFNHCIIAVKVGT